MTISLKVNGAMRDVPAEPDTPLLYVLRNDLALNGAKFGCGLSTLPRPSMVTTSDLPTSPTDTTQERTGCPSTRTVQAPHCDSPQPNFAPLSARSLRST